MLNCRKYIKMWKIVILVVITISAFCLIVQAAEKPKELFVSTFGGDYLNNMKVNLPAFEKEYNCKVTFVEGSGAEAHIRARNKEVDVVLSDQMYSARGVIEGLYEELDEKSIPNLKDLYDSARMSKYYVAVDIGVHAIAYNPKFVEKPTSWLDLWKPEYKDKVSMRSFRAESIGLLVLMAKLNGGDERNIDPGFKKMAELSKNNIPIWFDSHPQSLTLMKEGEIWLELTTDGRALEMKDEGADVEFAIPEEGGFMMVSTISVIKGRPNIELAKAFVNWKLSYDPQLTMTSLYAPTNKTVKIPSNIRKLYSHDPKIVEKLINVDWEYIVTKLDEWLERWNKEVIGSR